MDPIFYRKYHHCLGRAIPTPDPPLAGWEAITEANHKEIASKLPKVPHTSHVEHSWSLLKCHVIGLLYTYLAEGSGNTSGKGAFRALQRGFVHWSSGRLNHLEVNNKNPEFCHMRCHTTPSMKPGIYQVYILLRCNGEYATSIECATCQCAAG